MRLTGKCKEDFEKWYVDYKNWIEYTVNEEGETDIYKIDIKEFFEHKDSMQYGVFVDFFDSEDIRINIHSEIDYIQTYVNDNDLGNHFQFIKEARTEAIKKANEIYNKLMNKN